MIWFAPVIVFLAQALVLIHADICHTIDVATTRTYPPRLRLASVRLHDLICSSENIIHTPPTSEPETWYSAALEPLELSFPAPELVAPVIVSPSPTRTVACLVGSDNCMLYSDYSRYADGPSLLSTEPTGFSADVDDQDPAVPYQAPKGMSAESFKARRSQPIAVEIYIGLAICCIAALVGAFIVVSRIESARTRKIPNMPYRRSTSPSRSDTGLDDGNNYSSFFVLAQPTVQFPFSDMVYEQAIVSTHTELPFTAPLDNDETFPVTVVLGMQCNRNCNNVSRQEGETSHHFDSSDQQISDKLAADEDLRSGPLCIDVGAINTVCNRDIVTTSDGVSLNESATMSDVDTRSRVHTTAPTASIIDSESVQLPCDEHGLSCGTVKFSLPSHLETSGMPGPVCSASVSSPCKDSVEVLLADLNSEHGFLDVKITSGIGPASIPLPEPLDEFAMDALNGQHPETDPELEASGSVSGLFATLVNSNDVDVTAAISLVIGPGCLSPVVDSSGAIEERIQIIDPLLIPLPEPALDELETDLAYIPLPEDDFGLELAFESNAYESSIDIEITGRPASFEDKDLQLLHVASDPLPPVADELETDRLPEYGSDVQCESGTLTTGTIGDISEIEDPNDNKEQDNEHLGIPLGLSASIWAPSRDDLSEQFVSKFAETASHDGQGDALTISTSSPIASKQIPRSGNSFSARTTKKSIGNHRILNDAVRQSVEERSKQGSSLTPTTLRNIIIRDATVAHSMVHSVPSKITLSRSHRAPREVDVNSLASQATRSRAIERHSNSLSTSQVPIATTNLFAKILLEASMVLLAYPREVRMRFRNQCFQITLVHRLLLLGVLDFRDESRLREHVIAEVVEFIHPLITITHALCWIGPIRPGPKGPWAGSD
ncbi:hypothetical protein ACEPAI_3570 [Sanghuangporus weigelae]